MLGEELWFTVGGQHISFGASPQDVWSELGGPCEIHRKQVDQMAIHSAPDPKPRTTLCGYYFYNYFTRGLDILFDGQTHEIKKFVLHTNYSGHSDFNSYTKCNFVIHNSEYDGSFHQDVNNPSKCVITPSTKWEQVKCQRNNIYITLQKILGDSGRAAIQTQGSTSNLLGSTFVYGYPNVAFEEHGAVQRIVVSIPNCPSALVMKAAASGLAQYAAISQPEILLDDGEYAIERMFKDAQHVWEEV
ncbi:hypothetical protein SASPL_145150 [Salvia splendens]|uniref:Uncharacterized protein n=1 Tax=Salvia splendens TaxID=180675 RepID=A0A8X8WII4_SALSN|nr:hypothetical protein SASPL_145150 [Salvia splendens]